MKTTLQNTKQKLLAVSLLLAAIFMVSNPLSAQPCGGGTCDQTITTSSANIATGTTGCVSGSSLTNANAVTVTGTLSITGNNNTFSNVVIADGGTLRICGTGNTITIANITSTGTRNIIIDEGAGGNTINQMNFNKGTVNITNNLAAASTTDSLKINATSSISMGTLGNSATTLNFSGTGKTTLLGQIVKGSANQTQINITGGTVRVGANSGVSIDFTNGNGNTADWVSISSGATLITSGAYLIGANVGSTGGLLNNGTATIGKNTNGFSYIFPGNGNPTIKNGATNANAVLTMLGGLSQTNGGGGITNSGTMTVGVDNTYGASYYNNNYQNTNITNNNTGTLTMSGGIWFGSNTNCTFTNYGTANIGKISQYGVARNTSFYCTNSYIITNGSGTYTSAVLKATGTIFCNSGNVLTITNYGCMEARNIFKNNGTPAVTINLYGGNLNLTGSNSVTWGAVSGSTAATWTSNTDVAVGDYLGGITTAYVSSVTSATAGTLSASSTYSANTGNTVYSIRHSGTSTINLTRQSGNPNVQLAGLGVVATKVAASASTVTVYKNGTTNDVTTATNTTGANPTQCGAAPTVVLASADPAVAAADIYNSDVKKPVYKFSLAVSDVDATLSSISFSTTNSSASDIVNYKLWYKTSDDFSTATQLGSAITTSLGTGSHTFSSLAQSMSIGTTGYFWITVDAAAAVTPNNTLAVSALTTADVTFASANKSGTAYAGGTQTFKGSPTITTSQTTRTGFAYFVGSGPSAEQSYTVSGAYLTNDITITAPTNYEISTGTGVGFSATSPITLTQSGGTVSTTTIYVRLKAGLSVGDYNSEVITNASTGATQKDVTCSGTVSAIPAIALSSPSQVAEGNIGQNTAKNPIAAFEMAITDANASLTAIQFTTTGTYQNADVTALKLWYGTGTLSGAAQLGSSITGTTQPGTYSFSSLSATLNAGSTYKFWITADVAATAVVDRTITVSTIATSDITFVGGDKSGSASAGGTQTIIATAPSVTLGDNTVVTAANITANTTNNIIARFKLDVSAANNATLNQVVFNTTGTAVTTTDITNFKLRYSATNSFGASTQIGSTLTSDLGQGSHTFTGLSQTIAFSATGYFWITADVPIGLTNNSTITVSALAATDITLASGSVSGSTSASGTQTLILSPPRELYYINGSGNWSVVANWRINSAGGASATELPNMNDNVYIGYGGWNGTVTLDVATAYCNNMKLKDGNTLNLGANTLNVYGNLTVGDGSQANLDVQTGALNVVGNFTGLPAGGQLKWGTGTVTIGGNVDWGSTWGDLTGGSGLFTMTGSSKTVTISNSTITIPNFKQHSGSFTKLGTGTLTVSTTFNRNCGPAPTVSAGTFTVTGSTINSPSVGGTAAPAANPVCTGSSATISVSGNTGTTFQWQQSDNGTDGWASVTGGSGATTSSYTTPTLSGTAPYYRVVVTSGVCSSANSSSTTVTISPVSVGGTAATTGTSPICSGSTSQVTVSDYTGSIQWQVSNDGSSGWANVSGGSGATSATYTTPALTATRYYRAVVTSGACSSANSTVTSVTVDPTSVGGTVTGGTTICSGSASAQLSLGGNTGTVVKWQSAVSPFTDWSDIANTNTTYTSGALTETTRFRAVVQSGVCSTANAAYTTVTVNAIPSAPTGDASQQICNAGTLAGLAVTGASIKWYDAATGGSLLNGSTSLVNGTTYYATQTVSTCESTDRLAVTANIVYCTSATDHFRSKTDGPWGSVSSWESSADGITWYDATAVPTASAVSVEVTDNLSITNTTTASIQPLRIKPQGKVTNEGGLTITDEIVFESNDTKTGQFLNNGTVTNNGKVRLSKEFKAVNGWQFISFPFNVTEANIFIGGTTTPATWGDLTDNDKDFYVAEYDAVSRAAGNFSATSSPNWRSVDPHTFVANKGYIIAVGADITLDFVSATGQSAMFSASAQVPVNKHTSVVASNQDWNLIGIPLSSAFDLANATQDHAPYYCYNGSTYNTVMPADSYELYPFTAFFLQAYGAPEAVTFASEGRLLKSAAVPNFDEIGLVVKNAKYSDKTRIRLQDGASVGYELGKDAVKIYTHKAGVPQIWSKAVGLALSVNTVPVTTTKVDVSVTIGEDGTYTINLDGVAEGCQQVILIDGDMETDLLADEYSFAGTAGSTKNMSVLLVTEGTTSVGTTQGGNILIQTIGDKAYITGLEGVATVTVYDVAGKLAQRFTGVNNGDALSLSNNGIYVIDVKTATQTGKAKVSVKK